MKLSLSITNSCLNSYYSLARNDYFYVYYVYSIEKKKINHVE